MSLRILLVISLVCVLTQGQVVNRRQQFNLFRQQKQLETQQQVATGEQQAADAPTVSQATFDRFFEAIRTINELLQALSTIRARFSAADSTQVASSSVPISFNGQ